MLQQLQNLASDDIIHSYRTCPLVESFSENGCLNGSNVSFAESRVEDCLELNFMHVNYQTLAHLILQFLCLLDLCARNKGETFLSVRVSINASTKHILNGSDAV